MNQNMQTNIYDIKCGSIFWWLHVWLYVQTSTYVYFIFEIQVCYNEVCEAVLTVYFQERRKCNVTTHAIMLLWEISLDIK